MILTEEIVYEYLDKANEIMVATFPRYKKPTITGIKFSRAESFWAQITKLEGQYYSLKIGKLFSKIPDDELCKKRLMSCMIHELIHTMPGCWEHRKGFKAACAKINSAFPGYDVSVSTSSLNFGIKKKAKPFRYSIECKECGSLWKYRRKPKYFDHPRTYNKYMRCHCGAHNFSLITLL